jgi:predicted alpha/beta superfamily hydrolase
MYLKHIICLLLSVFFLTSLRAQNQWTSDYGSLSNNQIITNKKGVEYKIKVTLPPDYDEKRAYKPIYYLDSWWLSEIVLGSNALAYLAKQIESIIFIGISVKGDENDWHRQRSLDYTPSVYNTNKMGFTMKAGNVELDSTSSGSALEFMSLLTDEIIPTIENKISVNKSERGFIGHSFGGLFGIFLLQQKPHLFNNYILISPSLWWNKNELLKNKNSFIDLKKNEELKLFLSYGADENNLIIRSVKKFDALITETLINPENYILRQYENCDHNSVVTRAIYDGLKLLYKSN